MAADRGVEAVIGKAKIFHVHQLEPDRQARRHIAQRQFDHSGCQIDADDLTARRDGLRDRVAERSRPACQVEDPHPRAGVDPVDYSGPPMRFAA